MTTSPATAPAVTAIIDAYREASGMSEAECARRIGVTRQNLSLWRRNGLRQLPSREHLAAVARVCGVDYTGVLDVALRETGYLDPSDQAAIMPRDVQDSVLSAGAEYQGRQARHHIRRTSGDSGVDNPCPIGDNTVRILAWLWRSHPVRAVVFLADYLLGLNMTRGDEDERLYTVSDIAETLPMALSGLLTTNEITTLTGHAHARVDKLHLI